MASTFSEYPPELSAVQEEYLLTELKDWSISHGLAVRPAPSFVSEDVDPAHVTAVTAPVTLFPSLFPRQCYEQAKAACKAYNELYSAIASDVAWLTPIVEELIDVDDFMKGLWEIHLKVAEEGYAQKLQLGLFRSDYMIHMESGSLDASATVKQVEFNTIASSFGGLSSRVGELHHHLHNSQAYPSSLLSTVNSKTMPLSNSIAGLAAGLAESFHAYQKTSTHSSCVIFVVQNPERNVFDQRHIEYKLRESGVPTFRLPWDLVLEETSLDGDRTLLYNPPRSPGTSYEVATVYFRAGYAPSEYETAESWTARHHLERSRAVKCPSVLLQLAGTKKVQQVLATPHSPHLDRFLPNKADADIVRSTFAPIYPLDKSEAGLEARKLATNPQTAHKYVLKPQREGGGNNIYRETIPEFLKTLPEQQWPAYILMEMIEPPPQRNTIFRNGVMASGNIICELGIYGTCLWEEVDGVGKGRRQVTHNGEAGYLLRTKGADSSEGGVAAGFGSVDSLCLVEV
ncbi:hypothetical protein AMS68_003953 [Peltaster fructicola]|uniref:Glutathione synthetase n=1 Tax=Peltaster fructicola TaxID=286661 RepID=A0A6H0XUS4_9PEZI|nr:hypothetical protein AMS68_003953 [Peltaster fructicola]